MSKYKNYSNKGNVMEIKAIISKEKDIINVLYDRYKARLEAGQYISVHGKNFNGELTRIFLENNVLYGIITTTCKLPLQRPISFGTRIAGVDS